MTKEYTYKKIVSKAEKCYTTTKKEYKDGIYWEWSYYIAKAILNPKQNVKQIKVNPAPNPVDEYISRTIKKADYLAIIKKFVKFVEANNALPNYITFGSTKVSPKLFCAFVSYILYKYNRDGKLPSHQNINSKIFIKPTETTNEVYNYFVKVFGKFDNTIDGALSKIDGNGYGGYSDDRYSNKESIDRMNKGYGVNCTDSCHVFYNIMKQLIALGKYKKVECIHVGCSSGTGHVRLRITLNDGTKILRDPASVLDGNGVTSNWCTSNYELWGIDPDWFMSNLYR